MIKDVLRGPLFFQEFSHQTPRLFLQISCNDLTLCHLSKLLLCNYFCTVEMGWNRLKWEYCCTVILQGREGKSEFNYKQNRRNTKVITRDRCYKVKLLHGLKWGEKFWVSDKKKPRTKKNHIDWNGLEKILNQMATRLEYRKYLLE